MKKAAPLILFGTFIWSLTMVKSGLVGVYGVGFWGANGHDGIWHIAVSNILKLGSLEMPVFAGSNLQNYHIGFNLLVAALSSLTTLSISTLYFQILPPLFGLAIGLLTYILVRISHSHSAAIWSVVFVYFSTSVGGLIGRHESVFWAQQSLSTLINPPYALSLILLLLLLILLHFKRWVTAGLILALLPHIKIYIGILMFAALIVAAIKNRHLWVVVIIGLLIFIPSFLLISPSAGSLIRFSPFWFVEQLFAPDRIDNAYLRSAMHTFKSGQLWLKLAPLYLLGIIVFIVGNLGLRLVGIVAWLKSPRRYTYVDIIYLSVTVLGIFLPLLFIQTGTAWNTIQFLYYSQFILCLVAGPIIARFLHRHSHRFTILGTWILFLFAFLPGTLETLNHYLPARPPSHLTLAEKQALDFLSTQPRGVVLTQPFSQATADAAIPFPPRQLLLYESTAYVSAFSNKPVFLEDEVNLNITGFPWQARKDQVINFFTTTNTSFQQDLINSHQLNYLYINTSAIKPKSLPINQLIFTNSQVNIYKLFPTNP